MLPEQPAVNAETNDQRTNLKALVSELFLNLPPLNDRTDFQADRLDRICKGVSTWSPMRIFDEQTAYLLLVFPPTTNNNKPPRISSSSSLTKRQARRADYAITQRSWARNLCNCLRTILKGKTQENPPSKTDMVQYWRTLMTDGTNISPGVVDKRPALTDLWRPITPSEIKTSFPETNTCPGPDGLTVRQLRAVPLDILSRIFNLFMISGKLPAHLLKARTTLIPKKDKACSPEDYRPITVQSIMTRAYHKVWPSA